MAVEFGLQMRVKNYFFDRAQVANRIDAAKRRGLSGHGAFVRRAARSSIRKRKRPSLPGSPPSSHTGKLKDFIFFAYDPTTDGVVVGPVNTHQIFFDKNRQPVRGTVPEALEYGGEITILEIFRHGRWMRADLRSRRRVAQYPQRYRTVFIAARPYMRPANAAGTADFLRKFKDSVR